MKLRRATAAFTLMEVLVAALVSSALGGIIYTVATEGMTSFARNASINRVFTDARLAIDQITGQVQSAGNTPVLVDTNGVVATTGPAAGVRFYYSGSQPGYQIPSGKSTDTSLKVNFTAYQAVGAGISPVNVGDLATIPLIGFQATVQTISGLVTNADGSGQVTLGFGSKTIASGCTTAPTSTLNFAFSTTATPSYYMCMVYRQAAYIAVPFSSTVNGVTTPTGDAQLRYYPQAMSNNATTGTACGGLAAFNGTAFSNPANYRVIATISTATTNTGTVTFTPLLPFQITNGTVLGITLCAQGPDYNNRASNTGTINTANTFSQMSSSAASRCPLTLQTMSVPF